MLVLVVQWTDSFQSSLIALHEQIQFITIDLSMGNLVLKISILWYQSDETFSLFLYFSQQPNTAFWLDLLIPPFVFHSNCRFIIHERSYMFQVILSLHFLIQSQNFLSFYEEPNRFLEEVRKCLLIWVIDLHKEIPLGLVSAKRNLSTRY